MENRFKQIISFIFINLALLSCDQFEMRGFVDAYESADQRFDQSMAWNSEHPFQKLVIANDNYSFFVMGDAHIGGTTNLDIFLEDAVNASANAVVMVGDITMGYAADFEKLKLHLPAKEVMPSFLMVGNHDLYFDGWKEYFSLFGSTTYTFSVRTPQATDLYICLDSGSGTLGSKQLEWLKEILESQRSLHRRCVLFSHVNLFRVRHTFSGNPFIEELRVILELCAKYNIDMIISGHDHEKNVVDFGNTTFITMDLLQDDFKNSGYFKLSVKNGKIEYEFVNL